MRMLAIASMTDSTRWRVSFCGKYCHAAMLEKLSVFNFQYHFLPTLLTCRDLNALAPDILVIDDYFLTENEWEELSNLKCKTLAIDDALSHHLLPVDFVVNASPATDTQSYRQRATNAHLLLGEKYTLLRAEFSEIQPIQYDLREHVLITLGGADVKQMALHITRLVCEQLQGVPVTLLVGGLNHQQLPDLKNLTEIHPNLNIIEHCDQVAQLMNQSALAISAAGGTLGELAAMGVPTLALCSVDNQAGVLNSPHRDHWFYALDVRDFGLGDVKKDVMLLRAFKQKLKDLWYKPDLRAAMHDFSRQAIDTHGCTRILDTITESFKA